VTIVTSNCPVLRMAMFSTYVVFANWWTTWPWDGVRGFEGGLIVRAEARPRKEARIEKGCILKMEKKRRQRKLN
jgi:hypothetical protein